MVHEFRRGEGLFAAGLMRGLSFSMHTVLCLGFWWDGIPGVLALHWARVHAQNQRKITWSCRVGFFFAGKTYIV